MPNNSNRTTNFGPRVSFTTGKSADIANIHVAIPSTGTLSLAAGSILDLADVDPIKFSNITTASPTSTFIADGHFSVVSHSGNSIVLAIRSGATTYRFTNDAGGVL